MTGKELYEMMDQCFTSIGEELDPWESLTPTEQLPWEKLAVKIRERYEE